MIGTRESKTNGRSEGAARGGKTLSALTVNDEFRGTYLLKRVELKKARNGKDYLDLEVGDRSGGLPGKMWDAGSDLMRALAGCDFVEAAGRVELYNERKQAKFTALRPSDAKIDPRDFLPRSPFDPRERLERLRAIVADMASAPLRRLIASFLDDERFLGKLLEAPAAVTNHHAYLGGLIEHIVSLTESCLKTCEAYPALDRDLLVAGAFFHDIGKVEELQVARAFEYSDRGRLVGHIVTGVLWIEERALALGAIPDGLLDQLKHLVLSHHGELEWGSPVVPLTAEAIALHALDNLDAKLWAYERAVRDSSENGSSWTEWSRVFNRKLYKPAAAGERQAAAPDPSTPPALRAGSAQDGRMAI
ncbi:MAG: 3'-5' exoribonuclease YhaM family protein [Polyangiaceae bacterium]